LPLFYSRSNEAFNKFFLENKEQNYERYAYDKRRGAYVCPLQYRFFAFCEQREPDGKRSVFDRIRNDERPQKIIPMIADRNQSE